MRALAIFCLAGVSTIGIAWSEVTFESVKARLKSASQYHLKMHYDGPWGIFDLDYSFAMVKGKNGLHKEIRTEIERANNPDYNGTVFLYDESWDPEKIRIRTNGGIVLRNVSHPEIKGRALSESLFQVIQDRARGCSVESSLNGDETLFSLKTTDGFYRVWVTPASDIRLIISVEDGQRVTRRIYASEVNPDPRETGLHF